jgi:undecaprenyl-diphosphatase
MPDGATPPTPTEEAGPLAGTPSSPPKPEEIRRAGPLLLAGFLALLACAFLLAILAGAVRRSETFWLDTVGNTFMHGLASPAMDVAMNTASSVGLDVGLFIVAAIAGIVLVRHRRHREALFVAVVLAGSIALNWAMKLFFHRARPALPWALTPPDYSFPSGHSMNSMALGLAITLVVWRLAGPRWGALSLVLALLVAGWIGLSRIYLGAHYPTDVLGGFATAALWVGIVVGVFRVSTDWRRRWFSRTRSSAH